MTAWTDLVQKIFKDKSSKNSSYKLKHAMKDAAKVYKKHGKTAKKVHGGNECNDGSMPDKDGKCPEEVNAPLVEAPLIENESPLIENKESSTDNESPLIENKESSTENKESTPENTDTQITGGGKRKSKKAKKDKKRKSAKKSKK